VGPIPNLTIGTRSHDCGNLIMWPDYIINFSDPPPKKKVMWPDYVIKFSSSPKTGHMTVGKSHMTWLHNHFFRLVSPWVESTRIASWWLGSDFRPSLTNRYHLWEIGNPTHFLNYPSSWVTKIKSKCHVGGPHERLFSGRKGLMPANGQHALRWRWSSGCSSHSVTW